MYHTKWDMKGPCAQNITRYKLLADNFDQKKEANNVFDGCAGRGGLGIERQTLFVGISRS